ncbi:MAG: ribonuclease D [bacterium]
MQLTSPEFALPTFLVEKPGELEDAVERLASAGECAVDTESNSLYAYQERVCMIQVSTADANFLIDPLKTGEVPQLGKIMSDAGMRKYMHGADYDIGCMKRDFGFEFRNVFDTMTAAKLLKLPRISLAFLVEHFAGVKLSKKLRKSDWGKRPIPPGHLVYLARDTEYLIEVGRRLDAMLKDAGVEGKAAEEFRAVESRAALPLVRDTSSMWNVKGVFSLDKKHIPVFYRLYQWREREARRRDVPPFKVLGHATLLYVARLERCDENALAKAPGVTRLVMRRYGAAILNAAREGVKTPLSRVPRPPRGRGRMNRGSW